ncbi:hypothetical protein [Afifella sp. IM 167]|uniref:hypothetical protein n=1 Tax=Afifella sp. IM 167 TaxID=2033586 RepID=UPI001CCEA09C|nr:hypothetical protein [Afifella sp. IM 167]MBZ8134229.1 hypothetical protein [Afifella sp. IM 167]
MGNEGQERQASASAIEKELRERFHSADDGERLALAFQIARLQNEEGPPAKPPEPSGKTE